MTVLVARLRRLPTIPIDKAWLAVFAILVLLLMIDRAQVLPASEHTLASLVSTAPYLIFAVLSLAYLKASGAESVMARAFEGRETRMIVLAALVGGVAPFCSCEVIPFIAGLLALGTPLSAVMAFWLSSPLIDLPALLITAGALGVPFAIAKMVAAVGIGLLGGFTVRAIQSMGGFADPLRPRESVGCCSRGPSPFQSRPIWRFWKDAARREKFASESRMNGLFLLKWLTLAYLIESLMVTYVPAESIAGLVGGNGLGPIVLSALVGAPAYLNSYAAPPLVAGLMEQGMSAGAAMAFMVAGAASCIPAMTAVFALVKPRVFATYVGLGFAGAVISGIAYGFANEIGLL